MRSMIRFVFLAATAAAVFATEAPPPATHPPPLSTTADLVLREIRYDGRLSDTQAKFAVDIDAESSGKGEASLALFEGEVALLPSKLPSGVRIVREGTQYRLVAEKPGKYRFKLELVAKITRAEPWNQILFAGPVAGIAAVSAAAEASDVELQLLSGTPLESKPADKSRVRGVLGGDRNVALRWQSKAAEAARKALITCDTLAAVQIMPTVIKFTTELRYDIVQGNLSRFSILLPAS
ncbi:MAG TPA: hypothetical protein VJW76_15335, partial [Verrucomicrobiae bacterium]|nr:hypothetical protein [Verrucomicrobiae bacterium]